jgi:hypothetical protein
MILCVTNLVFSKKEKKKKKEKEKTLDLSAT